MNRCEVVSLVVSVDRGKYTFRIDRGRVTCDRHGHQWLEFEKGSKALIALLCEFEELKAEASG